MITARDCFKHFGEPGTRYEGRYMRNWYVPPDILRHFPMFPQRIYTNNLVIPSLEKALRLIAERGLAKEIKEWNGSYIVRRKRFGVTPSLHSWGVAFDINASTNPMGRKPTLHPDVVLAFKECGFDWGGDWTIKDGMHFQLSTL